MTGFRTRIAALATLISVAVTAALVVVSYVLLTHVSETDAQALAHSRAEAATSGVSVHSGRVVVLENSSEALDTTSWLYADGRLVDGTVPAHLRPRVDRLATARSPGTAIAGEDLLYVRPLSVDGHHVFAVAWVDLTPYEEAEQRSLVMFLALGVVAVALAATIVHLGVGRALRVVHTMAALADDWGDHQPGRRFDLGEPRDEFGELGRTLDRLLERLDRTLADERSLTDEVAHELRTPLTALRAEAQLAQLAGTSLPPATVLREVDRLQSAISTILAATRSRADDGARCLIRPALLQAVAGRDVHVEAPPDVAVAASTAMVAAVVSPLLDNALRHATSRARLHARAVAGAVIVDVLDDGAGFEPEAVDAAFEPGVSGGGGHGLGLAVVRRLAASAGATVRAVADGRGHVEVVFPGVPPRG